MWKDFFYFSKGQRTGIIVLVVLILLAITVNYMLPLFFPVTEKDGSAFRAEVEHFKKSLVSNDSLRQIMWEKQNEIRQREFQEKYHTFAATKKQKLEEKYTLFTFDPNLLDSAGFVRLGLKPYVAANIQKYRKGGGRFKTAADFGKVFGIKPEKFKELESYITIAEVKLLQQVIQPVKRTDIVVELNSADTSLLMQVKGIGRGYAKGIIRFRQQTGGFVSVDQLSEVYGMRLENLEKIRPFCKVNPDLVQKIKVNTATAERLKSHPYFNFYQAKALYEFRRKKGKLKDINELNILSEFTPQVISKLKPYLSFE
jgi:DNA uptake protein ComE-like DNA-binding protein